VLRSVRGLTSRAGTWQASWRYGLYGAAIDSAGSSPFFLRYRWTGREFDRETGLYFHRSRYYSPAALRFVQEDPAGFQAGPNLYAYGDGDPTTGRDPNGMSKDWDMQVKPWHDVYACMGTIAGCYEADPYGGNLFGYLDAMMFRHDILAVSHEDYEVAYYNRGTSLPPVSEVRAITKAEFEVLKANVADLGYPIYMLDRVTAFEHVMAAGGAGVARAGHPTVSWTPGVGGDAFGYHIASGMVLVAAAVFDISFNAAARGALFLHETMHYASPGADELGHCNIYTRTRTWTGFVQGEYTHNGQRYWVRSHPADKGLRCQGW